ncbi:MAG TPA: DUF2490 domain-containing protein [Cyclobacteriaceae bacterium]|jgi:hypothetical protein|nr:DUF2490 domain-containing protein [Cyclobacteriaceae bacterium]
MYLRLALVRIFLILIILTLFVTRSHAQNHQQLWFDYQLDFPFANQYLLEGTASYQTVLTKDSKWRSLSVSGAFEYVLLPTLDLVSELPFAYTLQKEGSNSFEISPILGVRYHITQSKKIDTRVLVRYQQRSFYQIEANDWDSSNRARLKAEAWWSINGPNLFTDKLWYGIFDYEEFIVLDRQLDERFANRRRARVGLGYRLNYKNRFDLIYTWQSSRDEIDGDFTSTDGVIQLRYKMYLNPAKLISSSR